MKGKVYKMDKVYMKGNLAVQGVLNYKCKPFFNVNNTAYEVAEMLIENGFTVVVIKQGANYDVFRVLKSYPRYKAKNGVDISFFMNQDNITIYDHEEPKEVYAYFKKFWAVSCEYNALKFVGK